MKNYNQLWTGYGFLYDTSNQTIWYTDYWSNVLCEYSLEKCAFDRVVPIPQKNNNRYDSVCYFSDVIKVNEKVFLLPSSAKQIMVYDTNNNSYSEICVTEIDAKFNRCGFAERFNNGLIVFPHMDSSIFSIDASDYSYRVLTKFDKVDCNNNTISRFQLQHFREDNIVYFLSALDNTVYRFDMELAILREYSLGRKEDIFNTINGIGSNQAILSTQNGEFLCVDLLTMEELYRVSKPEGLYREVNMDPRGPLFMDSVMGDGTLWFFPCQGNSIVGLSIKERRSWCAISDFFVDYEEYNEGWEVAGFSMMKETQYGYIGFFRKKGLLVMADKSMRGLRVLDNQYEFERDMLCELIDDSEKEVMYERKMKAYSLKSFLRYI